MPNEIVSAITEPAEPTARGLGTIVTALLQEAIDTAGDNVHDFDYIILNAVVRYAPERYPGAHPEIDVTLDHTNRSFRLTITETTP